MREKRIHEVMTEDVVTVAPTTPIGRARELAWDRHIRHLLVTSRNDVLGIACTCDLSPGADSEPISRFMKSRVVSIDPSETLEDAARLMRERLVGCLPVYSHAGISGILTRGDLRRLGFSDEELGVIRCAACGWRHGVVAEPGTPDVGFCLYCRERSIPPSDDEIDLGGG